MNKTMRKGLITLLLITGVAFAQDKPQAKQDTVIAVEMKIDQFRAVLITIDQNVDSKKISKELLEFLQKSAKMIEPKPQPILKAKE